VDASVALRGLQTALLAWAFGLACLLWFEHLFNEALRTAAWRGLKRVAALLLLLQACRLADVAWSLQALLAPDASWLSVFQTYGGKVLLGQGIAVLLVFLTTWFWRLRRLQSSAVLLWLMLAMLAMGLSGHVVSASEEPVLSVAAVLHVLLAQLWLAGLFGLLLLAKHQAATWTASLRVFSKWALPGMVLLLLSGVYLGRWSVGSWPGLLATDYGGLLVLKLVFVAGALWCAWQLRRSLSAHRADPLQQRSWLSSEWGLALTVVAAASLLAATVPASHDTILWPFSFRWAPVLAWRQDAQHTMQMLGLGLLLCFAGIVLWLRWRMVHLRRAWGALGLGVVAGVSLALPAISITAYPTTYMHSSARLDAPSVTAGQALYEQHCVACHGLHGHGDGPVAQLNKLQPANLTEPHVSWHTHGDMYWWLSHGKGMMPGFGNVLSEDERWHLINWLIALSLGYEARTITSTPAPFNPWLPSIDFRFQMDKNNFMSLSEWRGLHPVHLIIVNQAAELQRVRDLLKDMKGFPAQLVIVSRPEWLKDLVKGPCEAILVADADGEIARAWAHYRRSFAAPDLLNEETQVPRMEFLIDRFGFVRARWRSDEMPNALSLDELKVIYDSLAPEGEIKSAAIHQHD
jgi:putative copper resistance protein D